jgi:hypothetical protein
VVVPELSAEAEAVVEPGSSEAWAFGVSAAELLSSPLTEGRRGSDLEKDLGRS